MKKFLWCLAIVIFIILSIAFFKHDLDISCYLTQYNGPFFEFFGNYGELPIFIGPILFGLVFYCLYEKFIFKEASILVCFFGFLTAFLKVLHNKEIDIGVTEIELAVAFSLLLTLILKEIFLKIDPQKLNKIKGYAVLGLVVFFASLSIVEGIKNVWGRVRFRDLSLQYSEYTNYLTINWFTGHKSFPSGHTNAGTSILLISLMISDFSSKKWVKVVSYLAAFSYIFVLAFSRIVVSAHYASDVLYGFLIGFIVFYCTNHVLRKKGVIDVASDKR